jgi:Tol biopolymer transport system component
MKRWIFFIVVVGLLGLIALAVYAWLVSPVAGNFLPPEGATDVPVHSTIQISFSQPMQHESVERHLSTNPPRTGKFTWDDNTLTFTPDLPWPGGGQVLVQLKAGSRAQGGLGLPMWRSQSWSFTTAQALLVYLWPADEPADLYALDPLSGEIRQLTEGANVLDYSISRDGLSIYFSAGNSQAGADLFRLDLLSSALLSDVLVQPELKLACGQDACRSPQAAPNGKWLAYEHVEPGGENSAQVWLLDLATGEARQLGEVGYLTDNPSWSANNLLAYYDQAGGYVFLDLDNGQRFIGPNSTGEPGVWAPDGSAFIAPEIIYVQTEGGTITLGSSHLIRYTPFGPVADLTQAENLEDTAPAYSPDSATIAFARKYLDQPRWSFGRQLWLMNADGSQPRQVTQDDLYNHFDFAWSWDGRWLAYNRFDNASYAGPPELWLCDSDGSHPVQLNFGGYSPQWIP